MKRYQVRFDQLKVGAIFILNGNRAVKQSTKTLRLLEYNRWFYCKQSDKVIITDKGMLNHE